MAFNITYRIKDDDEYGTDKGSSLTTLEVDNNFFNICNNVPLSIQENDGTYEVKNGLNQDLFNFQGHKSFKDVQVQAVNGSPVATVVANDSTGRLHLRAGNGIILPTDAGGDTITIGHDDTSSQGSVNNSNGVVIQDITLDTFGHITNINSTNLDTRYDNYSSWTARDGDSTTYTITSGDQLRFKEGSGMDVNFTADDELTFTNTDRGSSQFIFKNVKVQNSSGTTEATIVADNNNDILHLREGGAINLVGNAASDLITINHADTSSQGSVNLSGNCFIQDITLDTYGHITGIGTACVGDLDNYVSWTAKDHDGTTYSVTSGDVLQYKEGSGMDVNFTGDDELTFTNTDKGSSQHIFKRIAVQNSAGTTEATIVADNNNDILHLREGGGINLVGNEGSDIVTIAHADTSSRDDLSASGRRYVTGLTFDTYGHVTGLTTGTETVTDTTYTLDVGDSTLNDSVRLTLAGSNDVDDFVDIVGGTNVSVGWGTVTATNQPKLIISSTDTDTTYSAGDGLTLSGTQFEVSSDITLNAVQTIGNEDGNYIRFQGNDSTSMIRFYTRYSEDMRLDQSGNLHVDGNVVAYSATLSDARFKTDIQTIDSALDKACSLRGVEYTWTHGSRKGLTEIGLIAQEVEEVVPEIVHEVEGGIGDFEGETYKTVDYEKVVSLLIESVKELREESKELRSMIEKLSK